MPRHFIGFWNVENLFGPEDHPHRLDWVKKAMKSDLRGWSQALYNRKLAQLASIITQMNGGSGPDILGVCEIEDRHVLNDLVGLLNTALAGRTYAVVHADGERDKRGIDTAFLYDGAKYTVDPSLIFNHFVLRRTGTRDILQATFRTAAGQDLILLCNHWPARSGEASHSAGFRATAGETLGYWHERIRDAVGADAAVMAMGDMNDEPWDGSVRFNANATRERKDVERSRSAKFYNMAWEYLAFDAIDRDGDPRRLDGTLYHQGDGNVFDQILVSKPLLVDKGPFKVVDGTAGVVAMAEMVSTTKSYGPIRFGLPKGNPDRNINTDGFSDHFPVSVQVDEADAVG